MSDKKRREIALDNPREAIHAERLARNAAEEARVQSLQASAGSRCTQERLTEVWDARAAVDEDLARARQATNAALRNTERI